MENNDKLEKRAKRLKSIFEDMGYKVTEIKDALRIEESDVVHTTIYPYRQPEAADMQFILTAKEQLEISKTVCEIMSNRKLLEQNIYFRLARTGRRHKEPDVTALDMNKIIVSYESNPLVRTSRICPIIEERLYIRSEETNGIYEFPVEMMKVASMSVNDMWDCAFSNVCDDVEYATAWEDPAPCIELTNKDNFLGAASLTDMRTLLEIAEELETDKIIIGPGDIHKVLICADQGIDMGKFAQTMHEIGKDMPDNTRLIDFPIVMQFKQQ